MEGGIEGGVDASVFKECLSLTLKNPIVLYLALTAALGSFLFGYDTGVINGAMIFIREDFSSVEKSITLQGAIVTTAVAGAIIGASTGGWLSDLLGRKIAILVGDLFFVAGSAAMGAALSPTWLIIGRILVGVGVGVASLTSPLYVSESSPPKVRGALVGINGVLVSGGQFISFLISIGFAKLPGTWRWMLGFAALPAIMQFMMMLFLSESPHWLYKKGREEEGNKIIRRLFPADEVEAEIQLLKESVEEDIKNRKSGKKIALMDLIRIKRIRRALTVGVGLQFLQQFVGINTVMYYSTTIFQSAGFAKNETTLLLSLVITGLNCIGTVISMCVIDRLGRRKLLFISLTGVILSLGLLSFVFHDSATHSPLIGSYETAHFNGTTCQEYRQNIGSGRWDCNRCLKASCGFCASGSSKLLPGACVVSEPNKIMKDRCQKNQGGVWYTSGCPSRHSWIAVLGLSAYILFFSPGMGCVPWVINSEIYPLRYRGICAGIGATANWVGNMILSQAFLPLIKKLGPSLTFMGFGLVGLLAMFFVLLLVPETKGLWIEEVDNLFDEGSLQLKWLKKKKKTKKIINGVGAATDASASTSMQ